MWCGEHIRGLLYSRFVWFSGLSPCWSMLRTIVPACMRWSGAEKRGEHAGLHVLVGCRKKRRSCRRACEREMGREGECVGTYRRSGALAD